jgi:hypothetical protein
LLAVARGANSLKRVCGCPCVRVCALARLAPPPQLSAVEAERESLQRRLRHLQLALDGEKARGDQAAEMQAQAIQKALASRLAQLEDLKVTDKRIIAEVSGAVGSGWCGWGGGAGGDFVLLHA